jgi:hypothetical protein
MDDFIIYLFIYLYFHALFDKTFAILLWMCIVNIYDFSSKLIKKINDYSTQHIIYFTCSIIYLFIVKYCDH